MVQRRTCSFCGNPIEPGTGTMFIKKDATVYRFCSSKCQSNLLRLGRIPRKVRWTRPAQRLRSAAGGTPVRGEEEPAVPEVAVEEETKPAPRRKRSARKVAKKAKKEE